MEAKKNILKRLSEGPVVGDGSMCMTLEKRGYCRAGPWTPEAVLKYPEAVKQLLREYMRAGADVLQTPCFYSSDGKLDEGENKSHTTGDMNKAACKIAKEVAMEGDDIIICGGLSPVMSYSDGNVDKTRKEFEAQLKPLVENNVDFLLAEFFGHVREIEICIEVCKTTDKPVAATMRIGPTGDFDDVSVEECAVRMARAGADIVGINCLFDINTCLPVLKRIKGALDKEGLTPFLMCQPLGWMCPEVANLKVGYVALPECPLALDARALTRFEVRKFARDAYNLGVRYIGGCCGMEPHHIRAIAQELSPEREQQPPVNDMCPEFGQFLHLTTFPYIKQKDNQKDFWMNLKVGSGRPNNAACLEPYGSKVED